MERSPILLGSRRVRTKKGGVSASIAADAKKTIDLEDEDDYEIVYELALAEDVLVLDDPVTSMLFSEHIVRSFMIFWLVERDSVLRVLD